MPPNTKETAPATAPATRETSPAKGSVLGQTVVLPENYQRIADSFEGLDQREKLAVIGQLQGQPDAPSLEKTVDQIIRNGGPKAELVARIFQRNFEGTEADQGGVRSVHNKKLNPVQTKQGGSGAPHSIPAEEPHTSSANPPVPGHPGPSEAAREESNRSGPS